MIESWEWVGAELRFPNTGLDLTAAWHSSAKLMIPIDRGGPAWRAASRMKFRQENCGPILLGRLDGSIDPSPHIWDDNRKIEILTSRKRGETLRLRSGQAMGRPAGV